MGIYDGLTCDYCDNTKKFGHKTIKSLSII